MGRCTLPTPSASGVDEGHEGAARCANRRVFYIPTPLLHQDRREGGPTLRSLRAASRARRPISTSLPMRASAHAPAVSSCGAPASCNTRSGISRRCPGAGCLPSPACRRGTPSPCGTYRHRPSTRARPAWLNPSLRVFRTAGICFVRRRELQEAIMHQVEAAGILPHGRWSAVTGRSFWQSAFANRRGSRWQPCLRPAP